MRKGNEWEKRKRIWYRERGLLLIPWIQTLLHIHTPHGKNTHPIIARSLNRRNW